jgi:hypothetical protein
MANKHNLPGKLREGRPDLFGSRVVDFRPTHVAERFIQQGKLSECYGNLRTKKVH